jgi:hypothetical protein
MPAFQRERFQYLPVNLPTQSGVGNAGLTLTITDQPLLLSSATNTGPWSVRKQKTNLSLSVDPSERFPQY